jgi:NTP pyrophosphatase (non-canonical NTP hydrolase)
VTRGRDGITDPSGMTVVPYWCLDDTCALCNSGSTSYDQPCLQSAAGRMMRRPEATLCQCTNCLRYLARDRLNDASFINNMCEECARNGIPLADIGTLTDPAAIELLALLAEECAEVTQRAMKIMRWGWRADFQGTAQLDKLEDELGDLLAAILLGIHNGVIRRDGIVRAMHAKFAKFREDAAGPRQRLLHAVVPSEAIATLGTK